MPDMFAPEIVVTTPNSFGKRAATLLMDKLVGVHSPLLVLPTGHTPLAVYDALATGYGQCRAVWDRARCLTLDEYAGLAADDERLFYGWLGRAFLDRVRIPQGNRIFFHSDAGDAAAEAARMDAWLMQNGPADVAVLGLGLNGHIGFNEPGSAFDSPTRLVALTDESIKANAAYWGGKSHVPPCAFTLGLGVLAQARHLILLVNGGHKAAILHRALHGPVTPDCPATFLRTLTNVTVIADDAAMGQASP